MNFIKIKVFYVLNNSIKKVKKQTTKCEKILTSTISDKGIVSRIQKELLYINNKKEKYQRI